MHNNIPIITGKHFNYNGDSIYFMSKKVRFSKY